MEPGEGGDKRRVQCGARTLDGAGLLGESRETNAIKEIAESMRDERQHRNEREHLRSDR